MLVIMPLCSGILFQACFVRRETATKRLGSFLIAQESLTRRFAERNDTLSHTGERAKGSA
jgi:hypothetical protein